MSGQVMKPSNFTLEFSTDGGTTQTPIPDVTEFDPGSTETEEVDVTSFDSLDDYREFGAGLKDPGTSTMTINWKIGDTVHEELRALVGGEPVDWTATYTDDTPDTPVVETEEFSAWVRTISKPVQIGGVLTATLQLRKTGAPTYA